ncbi:site-specific DNA-methyltransferase [Sarcina ventriculi]|uniref:site-specific DNA-methyltransferase n=1 Tax=Sarcina ventriculi TaxID=1267 RepID=UPI0018AA8BDB|nr:site-specific DNA-methyltransferase [Sarcina ventriculi]
MNVKLGVKKDLKQEIFNSVNENVKALESLFPSAVKDGQVDFKALKEELGQFEEVEKEKYELTWSGKQNAKKQAQQDILGKTLKYIPEDSKNPETTENLYIEGDNLEVLKLLRQNYYGSIKMIYIDPPYNTGNDFIYNDKFSMTKEESDIQDGTASELGERYTVNKDTSNRYHANWLNMMYPRLKVAKDLLTDDGVIFISIDDNEADNLKKICDEVFWEENCISIHHIQVRYEEKSLTDGKDVKPVMEYILFYAKNSSKFKMNLPKEEYTDESFVFQIKENENGKIISYKDGSKVEVFSPEQWKIEKKSNPNISLLKETWISGTIYSKMSYGQVVKKYIEPRYEIDGLGCLYKVYGRGDDGLGYRYYVGPSKKGSTRCKMYSGMPLTRVDEINSESGSYREIPVSNLMNYSADFGNIVNEGGVKFNSGKKPIKMLKELINYNIEKEFIVLDFFSGSASTAHAVMQLNIEDNGNRKFIMAQLNENLDETLKFTSSDNKKNIKNTINFLESINKPPILSEIGKERIRRAGEKIKEENKDKEGIEDLDIGFKVFRVGDTNIRWTSETVNSSTLDMFKNIENSFGEEVAAKAITPLEEEYYRNKDGVDFMPNSKDIDIVYEILLRQRDIHLSEKVELLNDIGERTYIFADSYLVCLEKTITKELIEKIASLDPLPIKFVFRDSAFEDNISLKDEAIRRLKALIDKNSEGNKVVYTVEFI